MGCPTPELPPDPPALPDGCDVEAEQLSGLSGFSVTNICEDPGCESVCAENFPRVLYIPITDCPACETAIYVYSYCDCVYEEGPQFFSATCHFVFAGCDPCDPSGDEAHTLANVYGFNPPRKERGGRLRYQNTGKFEPDRRLGEETRSMILASYLDKTNILVQYRPADLET